MLRRATLLRRLGAKPPAPRPEHHAPSTHAGCPGRGGQDPSTLTDERDSRRLVSPEEG